MGAIQLNGRYGQSEKVAVRKVADAVLIVPVEQQSTDKSGIYTLNGTASFLWECLDGTRTVKDIISKMMTEFDVSEDVAQTDIEIFITDLLSVGAIRPY